MTLAQIIIIVLFVLLSLILLLYTNRRSYYAGMKMGQLIVHEMLKNTSKCDDSKCSKCGADVEVFFNTLTNIRGYLCKECNTISEEKLSKIEHD